MQTNYLKRFSALVLAFIFFVFSVPAYADKAAGSADDGGDGRIVVESREAAPGGIVTVVVSLKDHPGVAAFELNVSYVGNVLELKEARTMDIPTVQFSTKLAEDPFKVMWSSPTQENLTGDLDICELTFQAADNAAGKTRIGLDYSVGDIYRTEKPSTLDLTPRVENGTITFPGVAPSPVTKAGNTVWAEVDCTDTESTVFCVIYDESDRMISMETRQVTSSQLYRFQFSTSQYDYAKVFVLDRDLRLVAAAERT